MQKEDYEDIQAVYTALAAADPKKADQHILRFTIRNAFMNSVFFGIGVLVTLFLASLWKGFGYIGFGFYALLAGFESLRILFVAGSTIVILLSGRQTASNSVAVLIQVSETVLHCVYTWILYSRIF